jgi:DNA polymerase I-like protein with 3'-5' exonuclease and polymerase domains
MHAARLLQNGIDGGRQHAGLAILLERYLGRTISKAQQRSNFGTERLTVAQLQYSAGDVVHLFDLRQELHRLMETAQGGSLIPIFKLDMDYLPVLARRELLGLRFDVGLATSLLSDAKETISRVQSRLAEIWGEKVGLNSPAQVKAAFIALGFPEIPNTADDTLSQIDHEAARLMQEYRGAQARVKELERITEYVHPDGRIYPDLGPLGTETARILSTKPTINNLSTDTGARACVLPDQPGYVVVKSDYSREEPRIVADVFAVQTLKEDFRARRDIYKGFGAQIFGVAIEKVLPVQSDVGKTNFLGVTYGEAWKRLVANAPAQGRTLSDETAQKIIEAFDQLYPEIREAWKQARRDANRGLIRFGTSRLGRRRLLRPLREQPIKSFADRMLKPVMVEYFGSLVGAAKVRHLAVREDPPEGKSASARAKNAARRAEIQSARLLWSKWETEVLPAVLARITEAWKVSEERRIGWEAQQLAVNYKIQAGGSDVLRRAEILTESRLPSDSRILLSNHDEICVSCPKEKAQEIATILQSAMHEAFSSIYPAVPIQSEVEILETWK